MLFFLVFVACVANMPAGTPTTFAAAEKEAGRLQGTDEGYAYMVKFLDAMDQAVGRALHACPPRIPGRKKDIRFHVVFIVSADGRVERILRATDSPSALCFTQSIRPPALPRPPRDHWPIAAWLVIGP